MASSFAASRTQIVYALCLPLAVLLGYFMAEPMGLGNLALVGVVLGVLALPVVMKWYHPMLVLTWNAAITPTFLPGQPFLWMLVAFAGVGIAVLNRFTNPEAKFVDVPSINRALLFLVAVVLVTAWLRGGIGVRSFGSSNYGGKGYFYILAAVSGYFALISQRIPRERAGLFVGLFFIVGLTAVIPNLALLFGSSGEFVFLFFPPVYAFEQAVSQSGGLYGFGRMYGLTLAAPAVFYWLLSRYGLGGSLDVGKPWRLGLLCLAFIGGLFGGFRGLLVLYALVCVAQIYFEGLLKTRLALVGFAVVILTSISLIPFTDRLPLAIQRTISILPVRVDPVARQNAEGSSEWRLQMWKDVLPEVPRYLFKGKGYAVDPAELAFAVENMRRGYGAQFQGSIVAGDYHSGPLSVVIPFGIWGLIGFGWFLAAGLRYLYWQYRNGHPALHRINTFLMVYFTIRAFMFFAIFGAFYHDLFIFTGLLGLSVSLNGPARTMEVPKVEDAIQEGFEDFRARKDLMVT